MVDIIPPTTGEILFKQCNKLLMMNPLMMSNYWTTLFLSFRQFLSMFDEEEVNELDKKIKEVEAFLSDKLNPMTLSEAEMRMFNNMDLLSGFLVNGVIVTQYEINQKLEKIKVWLTGLLYSYTQHVRFTTSIREI